MSIPKIIHRIWEAKDSPPPTPKMVRNGALWAQMNPGWEVKLWEKGPESFAMVNECLYRKEAPSGHNGFRFRADLLRLEILYHYGGLYVDMDTEPLRPLGDLLDGKSAVAAFSPNRWKGERVISNAIMAAEPGHPWIVRCIQTMKISIQTYRGRFLAMVTGPHHVNRCLRPKDGVHIFEPSVLYPMTLAELAGAYTLHAWETRTKLTREKMA